MRLIDLDKIKPMDFPSYEMDGLDVVRYFETIPTVDAAYVVHGRWEAQYCKIQRHVGYGIYEPDEEEYFMCSKYGDEVDIKTPYYANCGAKMDLKEIEK